MVSIAALTEHYKQAFTPEQAKILVEGAVAIEHDLVNREDFAKLTAIVERLADQVGGLADQVGGLADQVGGLADQVGGLADRMDGLAERVASLAAAQERTAERIDQLVGLTGQLVGSMNQVVGSMNQLAGSQDSMQRTFERFIVRTEEQFMSVRKEMREGYDRLDGKFDRLGE